MEANLRSVICPYGLCALESKEVNLILMETSRVIDLE